ncbi:hypothetical protein J2W97_003927 [Paenibacillus jamilae]|nr:hypothetical protein [Paenibacillus jamilae]
MMRTSKLLHKLFRKPVVDENRRACTAEWTLECRTEQDFTFLSMTADCSSLTELQDCSGHGG